MAIIQGRDYSLCIIHKIHSAENLCTFYGYDVDYH